MTLKETTDRNEQIIHCAALGDFDGDDNFVSFSPLLLQLLAETESAVSGFDRVGLSAQVARGSTWLRELKHTEAPLIRIWGSYLGQTTHWMISTSVEAHVTLTKKPLRSLTNIDSRRRPPKGLQASD